jgi:hypothetical protein
MSRRGQSFQDLPERLQNLLLQFIGPVARIAIEYASRERGAECHQQAAEDFSGGRAGKYVAVTDA